ncbi:putative Reticulocyte-binding protein 2 like protein a [Cladophialophora carrionii]|uniref:Putative Reticulocyte-binding protein 2 like protein a n=1 Tax=Cladophialophora carrionii TaxID=86049 RepID=A0A1C1CZF2_9EURO|nr:putative Reticulocyte-binding protein 2 like protein a [Cladophialophora carrionii]
MEPPPPPPPPPHGSNPQGGGRSGGLPDGKYDIFVIPPHSAGAGFLYLPSLQTQRNSFLAGVICTASAFFIYYTAVPVVKEWLFSTINSGGTGVFTLVCGVAVLAWALGKTQGEWQGPDPSSRSGPSHGTGGQGQGHAGYGTGSYPHSGPQPPPPPPPHHGTQAPPQPPPQSPPGTSSPPPQSSWQRPPPQANTKANTTNAKSSWEKAREETRKREEERKRAEELRKRREELEKERQRQKEELEKQRLKAREKELRERLERELKEKREREDKDRLAKAAAEEKAAAEKAAAQAAEREREKLDRERLEKERERLEKEKERLRQEQTAQQAARSAAQRPPMPTAATERDDDAYSFRPYDRPKRTHKANSAASMYSESSYAPSVSTAKTTPPPSMRGPYSTKDPEKIVIKGVYSFNNAFSRTPIAQLVSGQGNVTDGLILRITTEGLFVDDDVRGVGQREWDVKAWTMKSAEVWCPNVSPPGNDVKTTPRKRNFSLGLGMNADSRRETPSPSQGEYSAFVIKLMKACGGECKESSRAQARASMHGSRPLSSWSSRSSLDATASDRSTESSDTDCAVKQSCELSGLHVLRASIRDQEGKKYVFILSQSEGWKVAVGLQKLRRGSQVRALGVAGMPMNEGKAILENLGFV